MQEVTVINKISLDKVNIDSNIIKLDTASIIQTKLHKEDVAEIIQDGNNLIIKLKNGETITIENYFVKDEAGNISDLVFEGTICAFEAVFWENGIAAFKEVTGLEALLPIVTGVGTGGMNLLPWIVGGVVVGGIGVAGGGGSDHSGGTTVDLPPTVDVSYDPTTGNFTIDFSEVPYNPKTGKPFTADEIKDLITKDLSNNLNPDNIVVTVDPNDNTKFIVTGSPTDSLKDVTVDIPADSYEGKSGNLGGGDQATADAVPPKVDVTYNPNTGDFTIDFSEVPYNPATGKPYTPEEIKDLITKDPSSNLDPDNTVVIIDPKDDTKFIVTPSAKDPTQDVTVDVPDNSYTDEAKNPGQGGHDINDAPVFDEGLAGTNPDAPLTVEEDPTSPLTGKVTADDVDLPEGDEIAFSTGGTSTNGGVVTVDPITGEYTYIPAKDFNGKDSFTITVTDKAGLTDTITINVDVTPVNDAPVFDEGLAGTNPNAPLTVEEDPASPLTGKVTADDVDLPEGDEIAFSTGGTSTNGGVVTVDPITGEYTYIPVKDFNGKDSFTITVTDKAGLTDTITINVDVTPVNDAPEAESEPKTTPEDAPVSGKVTGTDVDGDTLTYNKGSDPSNGIVVVNPDGSYTYTPNKDFNGSDSFTVVISDGNGGTTTSTINVTVGAEQDAFNDTTTTGYNKPVMIDVLANDQFEGANPKVTHVNGTSITASGGAVTVANGSVKLLANGQLEFTPNAGFTGDANFSYTAKTDTGVAENADVTVKVNANQAPEATDPNIDPSNPIYPDQSFDPATGDYAVTGTEDVPVSGKVTGTDVDGDTLTYNKGSDPSNGIVVVNPDGSYTYTPNKDFNGSDSFTVVISDGNGGTTTSTVDINVTAVTDAPNLEVALGEPRHTEVVIRYDNFKETNAGFEVTAWNNKDNNGNWTQTNLSKVDPKPSGVSGFGVEGGVQAGTEKNEIDQSEMLRVDFDTPVTELSVTISWLATNEYAVYQAFDANGDFVPTKAYYLDSSGNKVPVDGATGIIGQTDNIDPTIYIEPVNPSDSISHVEFSAKADGNSDYLIKDISFKKMDTTIYDITIQATTGDIDGSEQITSIIVDVPAGATLSAGTNLGGGKWQLPLDSTDYTITKVYENGIHMGYEITGLTVTTLAGAAVPEIIVTVTAQEGSVIGGIFTPTPDTTPSEVHGTVINGGAGDDTLNGGAGNDTLVGGFGSDTAFYDLLNAADATAGNGTDIWTDFHFGNTVTDSEADKIEFGTGFFDGLLTNRLNIADYISITQDGANVVVSVDRDGTGALPKKDLLVLENNHLNGLTLEDLLNNSQIIIG